MKNKKGLSGIVTTLIIILLVFVAVGVIWAVVGDLLDTSTDSITSSSNCLAIQVSVEGYNFTDGEYELTIKRSGSGKDEEIGLYVQFENSTQSGDEQDFGETFSQGEKKTQSFTPGVTNATKIIITPFFIEENGNKARCPSPEEFEISE
jgi:flagellin-like protein